MICNTRITMESFELIESFKFYWMLSFLEAYRNRVICAKNSWSFSKFTSLATSLSCRLFWGLGSMHDQHNNTLAIFSMQLLPLAWRICLSESTDSSTWIWSWKSSGNILLHNEKWSNFICWTRNWRNWDIYSFIMNLNKLKKKVKNWQANCP